MSSNLSDICGSSSRDGVSGSSGVNSGDWICGDVTCGHSNFARRQQCKKCKRDRSLERSSSVGSGGSNKKKLGTEIGKAAAEKSRGLFSAEDWQCNKCANVNWARRMTCNMCSAPKFCDVEERTGFGGGYNDRGVVEYKEREESDSEYDEFGRLKKRRKNSFTAEVRATEINLKTQRTFDEEDEDDDEDGDDDDLAKYNLFSDDEEIAPSAKSKNNKVKMNDSKNDVNKTSTDMLNSTSRRSRSRIRSDFKRRQSNSSSQSSSSSSSTSSSSSSTSSSSSSSSSENLSQQSKSREVQPRNKKLSHSRSRSCSRPKSPSKGQRSSSRERYTRKRSHDKLKSVASDTRSRYSSKSRSKSRSSNRSSRSPSTKRNQSRNSSLSRKHSRSPRSNRKRATPSRSVTPKRRR